MNPTMYYDEPDTLAGLLGDFGAGDDYGPADGLGKKKKRPADPAAAAAAAEKKRAQQAAAAENKRAQQDARGRSATPQDGAGGTIPLLRLLRTGIRDGSLRHGHHACCSSASASLMLSLVFSLIPLNLQAM